MTTESDKSAKRKSILDAVRDKFMGDYASRDEDDVSKLAPMLFAVCEPCDAVRTAIKCLDCRRQKEKRSQDVQNLVRARDDLHMMVRELDHMFSEMRERYGGGRFEKEGMGRSWGFQDMAMMATFMATMQRSSANVSLDASAVINQIYAECERCADREPCKGAYAVILEYISQSLK